MPKRYHGKLHLANTSTEWQEVDQTIKDCIDVICERFDGPTVDSLLILIDLLGNQEYPQGSRENVFTTAFNYTFRFSPECEKALYEHIAKINPRVKARRAAPVATAQTA